MKNFFRVFVVVLMAVAFSYVANAQPSNAAGYQGKWARPDGTGTITITVDPSGKVKIDYGQVAGVVDGHWDGAELIGDRGHGSSVYHLNSDGTLAVKVYGGRTNSLMAEVTMKRAN